MMVVVRLFARARDLAGTDAVVVELPTGAVVKDLRQTLAQQQPPLAGLLDRCVLAVDNEFADETRPLSSASEIALLPPVSGG